MGRHKKLGTETCPKCGALGRSITKSARGRPELRYITRSWFLHNDRNIPECYIDNLVRPVDSRHRYYEALSKNMHDEQHILNRIISFPLTEEERTEVNKALDWYHHNIRIPSTILLCHAAGKFSLLPEYFYYLNSFLMQNEFSKQNLCFSVPVASKTILLSPLGAYIYGKYDLKGRIERNEKRNKDLSDWPVSRNKSNDFSGIEKPVTA